MLGPGVPQTISFFLLLLEKSYSFDYTERLNDTSGHLTKLHFLDIYEKFCNKTPLTNK